jgi:quercetin 2,3-dioxygenase
VIAEGDTQWMSAGGILHDELPTEKVYRGGGPAHAVQLWVNLPPALKMTPPRYQSITRDALRLLTSDDGGALIRLIAGDIAGFTGRGVTHTPITYAHATLAPGAQLSVPWNPAFSAFAYVLTGRGTAGPDRRPIESGQLVVFGSGDHLGGGRRPAGRTTRRTPARRAPDPRADRPLRAVRDEHPRRDHPGR